MGYPGCYRFLFNIFFLSLSLSLSPSQRNPLTNRKRVFGSFWWFKVIKESFQKIAGKRKNRSLYLR
jgi:hypothetical protein